MTRIRSRGVELTVELEFALTLGPGPLWDEFTDDDLALGWHLHGERIMSEWKLSHADRPWGWWRFEIGEDPPELSPGACEIRLAQLGELTDAEFEHLGKRAAEAQAQLDSGIKCYVATGRGGPINFEQEAIDLYGRVKEERR